MAVLKAKKATPGCLTMPRCYFLCLMKLRVQSGEKPAEHRHRKLIIPESELCDLHNYVERITMLIAESGMLSFFLTGKHKFQRI